jgi:primosomal protein N' (replication factor Y) (superfamily II helicase)
VSGRAGRAVLPGRVLIQTRFPEHPVYQAVASHQYAQFVTAALAERRVMHLPPYSYLALLRVEAKDVAKLDLFCENAQRLAGVNADKFNVRVWEPVASTLARKAGYSRKQLMVQSDKRSRLQLFLAVWIAAIRQSDARQIKWVIDVDPIEV